MHEYSPEKECDFIIRRIKKNRRGKGGKKNKNYCVGKKRKPIKKSGEKEEEKGNVDGTRKPWEEGLVSFVRGYHHHSLCNETVDKIAYLVSI